MKRVPTATTLPRSAGILAHVTSLPRPYGIGDLGPAAHAFVNALAQDYARTAPAS